MVKTQTYMDDCSFRLEKAERYLLFLVGDPPHDLGRCGGNMRMKTHQSKDIIHELDQLAGR
jgi:hypothetical protein